MGPLNAAGSAGAQATGDLSDGNHPAVLKVLNFRERPVGTALDPFVIRQVEALACVDQNRPTVIGSPATVVNSQVTPRKEPSIGLSHRDSFHDGV